MIWRRSKQKQKPSVTTEAKDPWGFEFYEAMYKAECDLREKMLARIATPTALTVAVSGALGLMLKEYARVAGGLPSATYWDYFGYAFWVFFGFTCVTLAASLYYLGRFWYGNEYKLMPTAAQLREYHDQLKTHYAPYNGADKHVSDSFRTYLLEKYVECSTRAADINHLRNKRLYKANGTLIISSLLALVTYGIFTVPTVVQVNAHEIAQADSIRGNTAPCQQPATPLRVTGARE
jgi:hypothetical protein